ncbi:MAG: hypothetical protein LJE70_20135 [Chromatiaceae bacterium]|nr:hypothetical protein [Chromatiaceae bacterium]
MILPTHPILRVRSHDVDGSILRGVAARLGINTSRYLFSVRRTEITDYQVMLTRMQCPARTPLAKSVALRLAA